MLDEITGAQKVYVTVTDNGKGITSANRQKIFDPFFTTKGEKGTGLGLWVAKAIVTKHEGAIRIRSHAERRPGTCISLVLPGAKPDGKRLQS